MFGKVLKVSGWGETETVKEPDQQHQLMWTHQRIFQVRRNLGTPNIHFLGDQIRGNGPCNSDSGGKKWIHKYHFCCNVRLFCIKVELEITLINTDNISAPATINHPKRNQIIQIGLFIGSSGKKDQCGKKDEHSLYISISMFRTWIRQTIDNHF